MFSLEVTTRTVPDVALVELYSLESLHVSHEQ